MYFYYPIFSTTVYPIDFTLSRFVAEDPRKFSVVECEVVWLSASRDRCK